MQRVIKYITTEFITQNIQKDLLAAGEEVLAYARTSVVVVVVGYLFLVIGPA
jgi:hypothetical protein